VPDGWTKVGGGTVNNKDKSFKLDTAGTGYRYYLVWITKLAPDAEKAEISEIRLLQEVAA
jgi:eukaryotic-like serine/threonine-protein kinase